jgi:Tol biopolymer transport system component
MTRRIATAVLGALALAALVSCSSDDTPTGPSGDCEGLHLLAFSRIDTVGGVSDNNLYLYDLDQNGYRLLRNANSTSSELSPAFTPEGRIVAFASARTGSWDIFMYDRCNEALVDPPSGVNTTLAEGEPTFSGDGNWLGFVRDTAGARRIRLVNGVSRLFDPLPGLASTIGGSDFSPSINQAATRIAFASNRNGDSDILVWDRGVGILNLPELAVAGADDASPSLSPDGRYVAFSSDRLGTQAQGGYDVYLYDLTTGAFVPLAGLNSSSDDQDPALSAPANYIVFTSLRSGNLDLFAYNRTTSALSQPPGLSTSRIEVYPALRWP